MPAVILAAGGSSRLGSPKQLLRCSANAAETLIERAVRIAREAGADPLFAVLGAYVEQILSGADLSRCTVVINPEWQSGMASSIRCGVSAAIQYSRSVSGVLLMTCDQPAVSPVHLRALIASHSREPSVIAASRYAGTLGVPAVLPCTQLSALLSLSGDQGARSLFRRGNPAAVDLPGGEIDLDTPEDLERSL